MSLLPQILIQSVCETMVPKLVAEDIPLLFSLLSDVFPGKEYQRADMAELKKHIRQVGRQDGDQGAKAGICERDCNVPFVLGTISWAQNDLPLVDAPLNPDKQTGTISHNPLYRGLFLFLLFGSIVRIFGINIEYESYMLLLFTCHACIVFG